MSGRPGTASWEWGDATDEEVLETWKRSLAASSDSRDSKRSTTQHTMADMMPTMSCEGAPLSTFQHHVIEELDATYERLILPDLRENLGGVLILGLGYDKDAFKPFAAKLGCPVHFVNTFGITGWSAVKDENGVPIGATELEEKNRGKEYGAGGPPEAQKGFVIIATRKDGPAVITDNTATAPTLDTGAVAHCVFCDFGSQGTALDFINAEDHAVCIGGFQKEAFVFADGGFQQRIQVILTLMQTETSLVNVAHSYAVYDVEGAKPLSEKEGVTMANTLPAGYKPMFLGHFQCFMFVRLPRAPAPRAANFITAHPPRPPSPPPTGVAGMRSPRATSSPRPCASCSGRTSPLSA